MVANVTIARRQLNGEKRSKKKRENRSKAFSPCYHNYCIEYPLRILPLRSCNGVTSPAFPGLDGNHTLCWWHWTRLRHLPKSNGFSSGWGSISNTVWVGLVAVNSNMRMRTELVPGRGSDPMSGTVFGHSPKPRVAWQSLAMVMSFQRTVSFRHASRKCTTLTAIQKKNLQLWNLFGINLLSGLSSPPNCRESSLCVENDSSALRSRSRDAEHSGSGKEERKKSISLGPIALPSALESALDKVMSSKSFSCMHIVCEVHGINYLWLVKEFSTGCSIAQFIIWSID